MGKSQWKSVHPPVISIDAGAGSSSLFPKGKKDLAGELFYISSLFQFDIR